MSRPAPPSLATTTRLVARALRISADELNAAFRAATLADLGAIVDLRKRVLGKAIAWDDARYLQWRYDFTGRSDARGSVLAVIRGDRVLGMIGMERLSLISDAEQLTVPSLMDIMVDPELDGTGLGIWLNLAIFARNPIVIEIGANPNSLGLISRLFHRLPDRRQYVAPLRWRRIVGSRLRSRIAAASVATPFDLAAKAWRRLRYEKLPEGWSAQAIERFDGDAAQLFRSRLGPREVVVERTAAYLNWRLFENPRARCKVTAFYRDSRLIGYWAAQVSVRPDGLRSVEMVDWLIDEESGLAGLRRLLQHAVQWAEAEDADYVSVTTLHATSERILAKLGFFGRSQAYNTVGVHCADPQRWPELLEGSRWFLTESSTDRDGIVEA
jgi:GNAT superfamily N-acetyltransferase